jgi:hypothetical protein
MTPQASQWLVLAFLVVMLAVTVGFDVASHQLYGPDATISRVLHRIIGRYPTITLAIVFAMGVFTGHCLLYTIAESP